MHGLQPFDPAAVLLFSLLNPVVIAVAIYMGSSADQPQKIPIAGFAAALAGAVALYLVTYVRIVPARGIGNEAGIFVLQFLLGIGWAALGYYRFHRQNV